MPNEPLIALLRAVNVGGNNLIPMADLRKAAAAAGFGNFRTYIQSGNCVYDGPQQDLAALIRAEFGHDIDVIILPRAVLDQIIDACPYEGDPSRIHIGISAQDVNLPLEALEALRVPSEEIYAQGRALYLHAPDGVGRSKLFAALPAKLDQPITLRNLKTLRKLQEMAQG